jgi:hypothetical protein
MELNKRMIVNNVLVRIWKEVVIYFFKVISQHLPGWIMETQNKARS